MLLSQDRLDALKEQQDYLKKLHEFIVEEEKADVEMFGTVGPEAKRKAKERADNLFKTAGLDISLNRLKLEIPFLENFLTS